MTAMQKGCLHHHKTSATLLQLVNVLHVLLTSLPSFINCSPADCAIALWILCKHGASIFTSDSVNKEDLYIFTNALFTR